jgi:hypothetical protein
VVKNIYEKTQGTTKLMLEVLVLQMSAVIEDTTKAQTEVSTIILAT